jgi:hypothetical protein
MWSEYYTKHFELHDVTGNDSGEEWTVCVQTAQPYVGLPKDVDEQTKISKFKKWKSKWT